MTEPEWVRFHTLESHIGPSPDPPIHRETETPTLHFYVGPRSPGPYLLVVRRSVNSLGLLGFGSPLLAHTCLITHSCTRNLSPRFGVKTMNHRHTKTRSSNRWDSDLKEWTFYSYYGRWNLILTFLISFITSIP